MYHFTKTEPVAYEKPVQVPLPVASPTPIAVENQHSAAETEETNDVQVAPNLESSRLSSASDLQQKLADYRQQNERLA